MRRPRRGREWAAVAAITVIAGVLRLLSIGKVPPDPFYDAAVRSMELSWHNFFFGAFEPGASVSIDKPPIDLWLQVASVKLFGFSATTLKLPEALGGTLAVPLIYAAVRRMWSAPAGLAAALAMAILPVEVITSRSDTMDAVMMTLTVLALLFVMRSLESASTPWLLAGAAALGLAFNVKLLESLVAVPGIVVLAYVGLPGSVRKRLAQLTLAALVYVAVSLSWLTATLIAPAHDRPFAIGSSNGSAWNAAFIFNGKDRLSGKSPEPSSSSYEPGHHYPVATQAERDHIPILPPSATRLLTRIGPLSGERLGIEILIGLLLGIPALLWGVRGGEPSTEQPAYGGPGPREPIAASDPLQGAIAPAQEPGIPPGFAPGERLRVRRAVAGGLGLWMLTGLALFSDMVRLHPRYVEGFTPAVAAMLGIGVAWAAAPARRSRLALLAVVLAITVYYAERLLYGHTGVWWIVLVGALGALALALIGHFGASTGARAAVCYAGAMLLTLVAVLAVPLSADVTAIRDRISDAGYVGGIPGEEQNLISSYVRSHQRGARYELAAESATGVGSLIVKDALPLVVLTTYNGRVFTTVSKLQRLIAKGEVRYAFINTFCTKHAASVNPACSAPVRWVREHGTDVSRAAGLHTDKVLYLLPGAAP
jgi:4-amino-4-deoxy-L-arabinose transferase-like glycosyltransferase